MNDEEIQELLDRWQQAMETLRPALEAWREAMTKFWSNFSEQLRPFLIALSEWLEEIRREELYRRLRRWHVSHWLARFLAQRWPKRWLPGLESIG